MDSATYEDFHARFTASLWKDVYPFARQIEDTEKIPSEVFPILRDMGAWALMVPTEYGGLGLTTAQYIPIVVELAKVHGGIRAMVHVHNSNAHAFSMYASGDLKRTILPRVATCERSVAFALTEPDHGTGADIGTHAIRQGDRYILNGTKWLITNSDFASHFLVFAKTKTEDGTVAVSSILVERDSDGFDIEPLPETMGCKGGQHGRLTFRDTPVPVENLIGEEGRGLEQMETTLHISRVFIAASSLGTAERAFELALDHARTRRTFGKLLAERQAIQRYIAEMAIDLYALRLMLDDCARRADAGQDFVAEAAMVKQFGLEAVGRVTDRALLTLGGIGYTRMHPLEQLYRDARLNWLEEGTPTIQYMVAAREYLSGNRKVGVGAKGSTGESTRTDGDLA
jgi:alkylation response protein AidB-like acyl-CoA dehydrogenase